MRFEMKPDPAVRVRTVRKFEEHFEYAMEHYFAD